MTKAEKKAREMEKRAAKLRDEIIANRVLLRTANLEEGRRICRRNHKLMCELDRIS